ncbi:MAG TPA: ABC transporter ATP-binding protein [Gallicola sp.]|nr:ABC transporter ATP-binding protein [Gallicola sp.]
MIKVENLSFRYNSDSKLILDDISVDIEESSVVSIIGLNGSGKTTFIKLLTGILKPTNGNIYINNENLSNLSFNEKSRLISYVPQLVNADYDFVVIDYLSFSLSNKMNVNKSPSKDDIDRIRETSKMFHIEHLLDKKINKLSGGEKQIVSICSAFVQDSPIIILDEPTSALDLKNQAYIIKILKKQSLNNNKTFILSTHNPNHALSLGGLSILLHDNKIINYGVSREIITVENLKSIYGDNIDYAKNIKYDMITTID